MISIKRHRLLASLYIIFIAILKFPVRVICLGDYKKLEWLIQGDSLCAHLSWLNVELRGASEKPTTK
jgi:hypothetical protein